LILSSGGRLGGGVIGLSEGGGGEKREDWEVTWTLQVEGAGGSGAARCKWIDLLDEWIDRRGEWIE